jgi:hypothetical protein
MVVITYFLGKKHYHIPYPVKKILAYLIIMLVFFFVKMGADALTSDMNHMLQLAIRFVIATGLMLLYLLLIMKAERAELKSMPFIGKYIR